MRNLFSLITVAQNSLVGQIDGDIVRHTHFGGFDDDDEDDDGGVGNISENVLSLLTLFL